MANDLLGLLETGATLGTGAVSGLLGMPYGLYKGITSGAYGTPLANRIAEEEARKFMERNTYQPRTQAGQENLQAIAGLLEKSKLPPVMPEAALLSAIPVQAYAAQAERAGMAAEKAIEPAVRRTMERGGLPAQLLGDLAQGSIRPMDVWHGSPHGPFAKFDPTKIGSGEGAQAFSYGHYLGEARGTGEGYRKTLSKDQFLTSQGLFDPSTLEHLNVRATLRKGDLDKAIEIAKKYSEPDIDYPETAAKAARDLEKLEAIKKIGGISENQGYLYKVDLPDEAIANMLDWDKPYNKQPKQVQDALKNSNVAEIWKAQYGFDIEKNQPQMDMVYKAVAEQLGSPAAASQYFKDLGILGTRYLDEGSRAAGKGTSNFVVFPGGEDLLTIKEINDKPIGGLLGQSKAAEATDLLSYRGSHTAPGPDFGAPLYDLTGGGQMYPADVYSSKAAQYYGGGVSYDQKAMNIAQSFKDKPNATVTIYRAVPKEMSNSEKLADIEKQMAAYMKRGTLPKDAENFSSGSKWYDWAYDQREALRNLPDEPKAEIGINSGDWVTLTKEYAKDHGESALNGQYKIISKKVKAKDIWTNADSIHEFGYHPSE